jgi:flavin reductase (DIM6/NTAB) family NADH-FMN oxidoreductase RutF
MKTEYRQALGRFATGVTVIAVNREDGGVQGMTANSFASVSLAPPLISVCVDERSRMMALIQAVGRFGVTVLREGQEKISEYFAFGPQDAFDGERLGVRFTPTQRGAPWLDGGLASFDCRVAAAHVAGDHTIFVAEVEEFAWTEGNPLLYFSGGYRQVNSGA